MISFDFSQFFQTISPKNIAEKATSYSVGGVPLITYGFIGITVALLSTVHLVDNTEESSSENTETSGLPSESVPENDPSSESVFNNPFASEDVEKTSISSNREPDTSFENIPDSNENDTNEASQGTSEEANQNAQTNRDPETNPEPEANPDPEVPPQENEMKGGKRTKKQRKTRKTQKKKRPKKRNSRKQKQNKNNRKPLFQFLI